MQSNSNLKSTALFIGGQSLLMRCVELWLEQGNEVVAIVSDEPEIEQWASSKGINAFQREHAFATASWPEFDYIFSVVNLKVTPVSLLRCAKKMAINFHDGPLPQYAGLNVTNWALLNNEAQHGISWHLMEEAVDRGDLLLQTEFPIDADETAFTLNAKCFQAGLTTFSQLIEQLQQGSFTLTAQHEPINHFSYGRQKPQGSAVLDWGQSAETLNRLSRALDFGGYPNPITSLKFRYDGNWYSCGQINIVADQSPAGVKPGIVQFVAQDRLQVSTATGVVELTKLASLDGELLTDLTRQFEKDQPCELVALNVLDQVKSITEKFSGAEPYWRAAFKELNLIELPFSAALANDATGQKEIAPENIVVNRQSFATEDKIINLLQSRAGDASSESEKLASLFLFFIARLTGSMRVTVPLDTSQSLREAVVAEGVAESDVTTVTDLFASLVPLVVEYDPKSSVTDTVSRIEMELLEVKKRGTFARDLVTRTPVATQSVSQWIKADKPVTLTFSKQALSMPEKLLGNSQLMVCFSEEREVCWIADPKVYDSEAVSRLQGLFAAFLQSVVTNGGSEEASRISLLPPEDQRFLMNVNDTSKEFPHKDTLVTQFERQVSESPERPALIFRHQALTYRELNERSNRLARLLRARGVSVGSRVGILLFRSHEMVVAMLATLKLGAAYVPLDPTYPSGRVQYMISDADLSAVVINEHYEVDGPSTVDLKQNQAEVFDADNLGVQVEPTSLAYMIYTSGSTGRPKGVMVSHRNVMNFFSGMDEHLLDQESRDILASNERFEQQPQTWLAVTSISFDISVLELFWTLTRGLTVLLYRDPLQNVKSGGTTKVPDKPMQFGLFFWNHISQDQASLMAEGEGDGCSESQSQSEGKYDLLFEAAAFADKNQFSSIFTPERHFGEFGGDYPNPSVISAALAMKTHQIQLRAGSCVLPLHHPARVVEEWSIVDHLSDGRVAVSFASGWQPNDFVLMPENHANAKQVMLDNIEVVQKLWRGESAIFPGPKGPVEIKTQPRPKQDAIPVWLTTAGNPETFKMAGERGYNLLTHLLGQSIEQVSKNIEAYRTAWKEAGHAGEGVVTLMLHTLVGAEGVESEQEERRIQDLAREPMKSYLKSAMFLVKQAAWHFPTFEALSQETGESIDELFSNMDEQTLDDLLEFAFLRYYQESGLFGTFGRCLERVDELKRIGVDEIGCLIDYGLSSDNVMSHLPNLAELLRASNFSPSADPDIAELAEQYPITHLQCTPSQSSLILADPANQPLLNRLSHLLLGGEALPQPLAQALRDEVSGNITNVYGPTETTIWSTAYRLPQKGETISKVVIGKPLVNTRLYVVDEFQQPLPVGVAGELLIGGEGVTPGYYQRTALTAERYIEHREENGGKLYRTGDIARWSESGDLEYLGRADFQVKIRGYRIELGEIESCLMRQVGISQAVVTAVEQADDQKLVAYLVINPLLQSATHNQIESQLKEALSRNLPLFMVPSIYCFVDQLPLTPNGKVDRKRLPDLESYRKEKTSDSASGGEVVSAPSSDAEKQVLSIWQAVLGHEVNNLDANFFDIGGHSLLAIKVLADLRAVFEKPVQITDIFRFTTIRTLAEFLASDSTDNAHLEKSESRATARREALSRRRRRR